jgi:hypothetical protein
MRGRVTVGWGEFSPPFDRAWFDDAHHKQGKLRRGEHRETAKGPVVADASAVAKASAVKKAMADRLADEMARQAANSVGWGMRIVGRVGVDGGECQESGVYPLD